MAEVGDNRVAVYIDFDNIVISLYNQLYGRGAFQSDRVRNVVIDSPSADPDVVERIIGATVDIGAILDYASSFGTVVISRAYADWSQPVNAGYRRQLIDRAIDLTQMFPLSATKNGADIRLAIDVVEDMFRLSRRHPRRPGGRRLRLRRARPAREEAGPLHRRRRRRGCHQQVAAGGVQRVQPLRRPARDLGRRGGGRPGRRAARGTCQGRCREGAREDRGRTAPEAGPGEEGASKTAPSRQSAPAEAVAARGRARRRRR